MMMRGRKPIFLMSLVSLVACGTQKKGTSAKITMEMANVTGSTALTDGHHLDAFNLDGSQYAIPSYLGLKIVFGSLMESFDETTSTPSGVEALTYSNPSCTYQKETKTINDKEYEYASPGDVGGCAKAFVDFARPSAEVNADLNAQQFSVPPGTYTYARFCLEAVESVAVKGHLSTAKEFSNPSANGKVGGCTFLKAKDFTVAEGDVVKMTVDYDLAQGPVAVISAQATSGATLGCQASENAEYQVCVNGGIPFSIKLSR